MRKAVSLLTALTIVCALAVFAPASAVATNTLNSTVEHSGQQAKPLLKKIENKNVLKGKSVKIKPVVKSSNNLKVVSKTISVKQGSRTIVTNKTSARLKAGKYAVTTVVKYKSKTSSGWGKTKKATLKQKLKVTTRTKVWMWLEDYEKALIKEMNVMRKEAGIQPLTRSTKIENRTFKVAGMYSGTEKWNTEYVRKNVDDEVFVFFDYPASAKKQAYLDVANLTSSTHLFNTKYNKVGISLQYYYDYSGAPLSGTLFIQYGK